MKKILETILGSLITSLLGYFKQRQIEEKARQAEESQQMIDALNENIKRREELTRIMLEEDDVKFSKEAWEASP